MPAQWQRQRAPAETGAPAPDILSHPDYDRRLWIRTRSARPCTHAMQALAGFFMQHEVTAGGEFHPALRIIDRSDQSLTTRSLRPPDCNLPKNDSLQRSCSVCKPSFHGRNLQHNSCIVEVNRMVTIKRFLCRVANDLHRAVSVMMKKLYNASKDNQ